MSKDTAELWAAVSATAVATMALVGAVVRYALLPWLREHLIGPLLARLDAIALEVKGVTSDLTVASRMFEGHITASEEDRARLWAAVDELRAKRRMRRRRHTPTHRED